MKDFAKGLAIIALLILGAALISGALSAKGDNQTFGDFISQLDTGRGERAVVNVHDHTVQVKPRAGSKYM
jgi:hypothetical protein